MLAVGGQDDAGLDLRLRDSELTRAERRKCHTRGAA
jgi:hypothetical protein